MELELSRESERVKQEENIPVAILLATCPALCRWLYLGDGIGLTCVLVVLEAKHRQALLFICVVSRYPDKNNGFGIGVNLKHLQPNVKKGEADHVPLREDNLLLMTTHIKELEARVVKLKPEIELRKKVVQVAAEDTNTTLEHKSV
ncbi:unnamed protein product [Sphenostylis stenocarpa]|uniref:Uncharacterized protein n=1 Tax=Sphenostylis stenocarpa TaxID=92480 RepID=A0AA86SW30_9FABA|nr:unnamed protein product [Sphenostylis stenocarpa]